MRLKTSILLAVSFIMLILSIILIIQSERGRVTGFAARTAQVGVCVGHSPVLEPIGGLAATEGTPFYYDVNHTITNSESVTYYDTASFFTIDPTTGEVSFTAQSSDVGAHTIVISVNNTACPGLGSMEELTFSITAKTPTPPTGAAGGAGGGGLGRAVREISSFKTDKDLIKARLTPGGVKEDSLRITNTGDTELDINITVNGLADFLIIKERNYELGKGKEELVNLIFIATEDKGPGVYTGQIIITAGSVTKKVDVAVEVESKMALFDVNVEIPTQFKTVTPGEGVLAAISLYNLGLIKRVDVFVEYGIKDFNDNIITVQEKTIAVETQASFVGILDLPEAAEQGKYLFYVKIEYDHSVAVGSDEFNVVGKKPVGLAQQLSKIPYLGSVIPHLGLVIVVTVTIIAAYLILLLRKKSKNNLVAYLMMLLGRKFRKNGARRKTELKWNNPNKRRAGKGKRRLKRRRHAS